VTSPPAIRGHVDRTAAGDSRPPARSPPAPDHPLLVAWRDPAHPAYEPLLVNPHAAIYSVEGLLDMRTKGTDACRRVLLGLPLRNVVN
jgi:C-terminal binding protein